MAVESVSTVDGYVDRLEVHGDAAFNRMRVGQLTDLALDDTHDGLIVIGDTTICGRGNPTALTIAGGDLVLSSDATLGGGVLRTDRRANGGTGVRLDVIFDDLKGCGREIDESPRRLRKRGPGILSEVKNVGTLMPCESVQASGVGVLRSIVPHDPLGPVLQTFWTEPFTGEKATGLFMRHSFNCNWSPWRELVGQPSG